jgi:NADPH:quinone reductase
MKCLAITEYGDSSVLKFIDLPMPTPGPRDVVVENRATGVNPIDFKVRAGVLGAPVGPDAPIVVGWDGAGVVTAVGAEVTGFSVGDEVYYAGDIGRAGSYAAYTAVDARAVAYKPRSLSFTEAAAVPLVTETAWETLKEVFAAQSGQSLLIYNGAGGVGSIAIQLAKLMGLVVIASASRVESRKWCTSMGADHIVDHSSNISIKQQLADLGMADGVDFVFHLHDPENVADLVAVLKPMGAIALTWPASGPAMSKLDGMDMFLKRKSIRYTLMFTRLGQGVHPELQGELLKEVAGLYDSGKLQKILTTEMSWKDVAKAHSLQESGKMCGKIVMTID